VDLDQDPGGPKTCGSGSGTLLKAHLDHKADVHGGAGSDGDHVNVPDVLRPNLHKNEIKKIDELTNTRKENAFVNSSCLRSSFFHLQ
jgi:hypothetical protein